MGCDAVSAIAALSWSIFQSTHPSGVRLFGQWSSARIFRFQSTHPSGVRLDQYNSSMDKIDISIHAPQWGATCGGTTRYAEHVISIHAPQWGATCHGVPPKRLARRFQSTHPSGVRRPSLRLTSSTVRISIHAPQWGATRRYDGTR